MGIKMHFKSFLKSVIYFLRFKILKEHKFALLTHHLSIKEIIFKAPPLNKEIIRAIHLISPQYILQTDDKSRKFWEIEQNACCWGEYEVLNKYLSGIPQPKRCLEIGPGMGRSVVFLIKKFNWKETECHLYESHGTKTKYTLFGPKSNDSFCGALNILKDILKYNGINNYSIFDAKNLDYKLDRLPGPYDVIYSFYAVGFHWHLEYFFDELLKLMHETTLAFFIVPNSFWIFEKMKKINFKLVDYVASQPPNRLAKMLIMSRGSIGSCGSSVRVSQSSN